MGWFETIGRHRAAWRVSAGGVVWVWLVVCVCVCESAVLDGMLDVLDVVLDGYLQSGVSWELVCVV